MEKLNLNELSDATIFDGTIGPFTAPLSVATISVSLDGCAGSIFNFSISLTGKSNWNVFSPNVDVNDFFTKYDLDAVLAVAVDAALFLFASLALLLSINWIEWVPVCRRIREITT